MSVIARLRAPETSFVVMISHFQAITALCVRSELLRRRIGFQLSHWTIRTRTIVMSPMLKQQPSIKKARKSYKNWAETLFRSKNQLQIGAESVSTGEFLLRKKYLGHPRFPFNHLFYTSTVGRKPVIVHNKCINWSTDMRLTTTLAAAAAIAVSGAAVNAGGLAPVIPEAPVVVVDTPAPTSSINSGYVVLGLLAALVAASASF